MGILDTLRAVARTAQSSHLTQAIRQASSSPITMGRHVGKNVTNTSSPLTSTNNPLGRILQPILGAHRTNQALSIAKIPKQFVQNDPHGVTTAPQVAWAIALGNALDVVERSPQTEHYISQHGAQQIDHFGIRTLDRHDFSMILNYLGYRKHPDMEFKQASLTGSGWHHPEHGTQVPMYFLSEWQSHINPDLKNSEKLKALANWFEEHRHTPTDTVQMFRELRRLSFTGQLDEETASFVTNKVLAMFKYNYPSVEKFTDYTNLTTDEYRQCVNSGADALAWILTNGQHPNHLAVTVNHQQFEQVREELKKQYGEFLPTQVSNNGLLKQTANRAEELDFKFTENGQTVTQPVLGPFLEFCARDTDPKTQQPYTGFDAGNANNIFNYSTVINPVANTPRDPLTEYMLNPTIVGRNADS